VQKQHSELAQLVVHVLQVCDEENGILKEEFDWLKNGIMMMESL
jgi:hypothetical protein